MPIKITDFTELDDVQPNVFSVKQLESFRTWLKLQNNHSI